MLPPFPVLMAGGTPRWAQGFDLWRDYTVPRGSQLLGFPPGTDTHAQAIYAQTSPGIYQSFAANVPTRTDLGLQTVPTRTNSALWCRDLTNAAWVKTNATAALNQTGIDGAATAASSLTATAGNATALQTIALASSADTYSVFMKRLTGTGTINITMDGGLTWTPVVLTAAWQRFQIQQTFLNPVFGIQIVTNGDAVAVDFNQLEVGGYASSPILTTTVAVAVTGNQTFIGGLTSQFSAGVALIAQFRNLQRGSTGDFSRVFEVTKGAVNAGTDGIRVLRNQTGAYFTDNFAATVNQGSGNIGPTIAIDQTVTIAAMFSPTYTRAQIIESGAATTAVTSATYPSGLDRFTVGADASGGNKGYEFLRKLAVARSWQWDATGWAALVAKATLAAAA